MAEQPPASPPPPPRRPSGRAINAGEPGGPRIGNLPVWAVVAIAIGVAFLVWLLFIQGDDDSDSTNGAQATKQVNVVSASALPGEVGDVDYPVYWLGPEGGIDYEVTVITDGRTYVRYLPKGEPAESPNLYLTVGSYSQAGAFDILKDLAKGPTNSLVDVPNGGLALTSGPKAQGVYVAFPGVDTQIEVYDPKPGRALQLAKSGALTQIG